MRPSYPISAERETGIILFSMVHPEQRRALSPWQHSAPSPPPETFLPNQALDRNSGSHTANTIPSVPFDLAFLVNATRSLNVTIPEGGLLVSRHLSDRVTAHKGEGRGQSVKLQFIFGGCFFGQFPDTLSCIFKARHGVVCKGVMEI